MTKKVALTDAGDVTDSTIVVTILTNTNVIMVRNFSFSNPARNSVIAACSYRPFYRASAIYSFYFQFPVQTGNSSVGHQASVFIC